MRSWRTPPPQALSASRRLSARAITSLNNHRNPCSGVGDRGGRNGRRSRNRVIGRPRVRAENGRLAVGAASTSTCAGAAAGAIVACSGIVLGALLPVDDASGSSGQATPQATAMGDQTSPGVDVPDLPIQVAVQLERDRHWAEGAPAAADGTPANPEAAKETVVAGVWAPD